MTNHEIREAVLNIIRDISPDADLDHVEDEKNLRDQLGLDSMDFLDIVMELRKRYHIEVPQEDYPKLATMKSCVEYLGPSFST